MFSLLDSFFILIIDYSVHDIPKTAIITTNITGIVIQESRCEIIAIPAATVVSFPYALGITIVFNPSGMATELTAQIISVSD